VSYSKASFAVTVTNLGSDIVDKMANVALSGPVPPAVLTSQPDTTSLKDRTVLVTGGAQGLGEEIVKKCAAAGARVTIADIDDANGRDLASALGEHVQFIHCDVTKWADQVAAFKAAIRFAAAPSGGSSQGPSSSPAPAVHLDHLVINAGIMDKPFFVADDPGMTNLDDDPPEPDARPIDVNTKGAMFSLKLAQLYMASAPATRHPSPRSVVFILSPESYITLPASIIYGGAKFGTRGLFRSARVPFANKGVRVNAVVPWLMETGMNAGEGGLSELLNSLGARFVPVEFHARQVMQLLSNDDIAGRAVAVGQLEGGTAIDVEEEDTGGEGVKKYWDFMLRGWPEGLESCRKVYGMMGFQGDKDRWF
jgi:5'-hydroxyaverantin dehydrogenase